MASVQQCHVDDSGPKLKLVNTFAASFRANLAGPFVDPYLRLCKRGRLLSETPGRMAKE